MDIRQTNHNEWNQFMLREGASFLQSWEWGEMQKMQGRNIARIAVGNGEKIVFAAQIIRHELPFGFSYAYVPFGPVAAKNILGDENALREAVRIFVNETKKTLGGFFLFCESDWVSGGEEERLFFPVFREVGFRGTQKHIQPEQTLLIDLRQSEDELLKQMEKSTRYNIGYAERVGVTIQEMPSTQETARQLFHFLQTRAEAKEFFVHPLRHYEALAEIFDIHVSGGASARFFGAYYKNECVGMNAIVFFGKIATNLLSGVSREHRNLKAANLLRWHAMREAKKSGCEVFDQWGISEKFSGVSAFKRGFGGKEVRRTDSLHLPFNNLLYFAYRLSAIVAGVRNSGFILIAVLAVVAVLVAFNTIRLAIYTAREEINVMRLVGATSWFIRGPFLLQGILQGAIAASITVGLFYPLLWFAGPRMAAFLPNIDLYGYFRGNFFEFFGILLGFGIFLGVFSSFIAMRKYLRV